MRFDLRPQNRSFSRTDSSSLSQLGRISASPEPVAPADLPFEEKPALVRTAHTMNDFLVLEAEISRLERSDFKLVPTSAILPASDLSSQPVDSTASKLSVSESKNRVAALIRSLNPTVLPALPTPSLPNGDSKHSQSAPSSPQPQSQPLPAAKPTPGTLRDPAEPVESLWWDLVGATSVSSKLFPNLGETPSPSPPTAGANRETNGHATEHAFRPPKSATEEVPIAALAAGVPRIPWVGYRATPYTTTSTGITSNGRAKGKGKVLQNGSGPTKAKETRKKGKNTAESGLATRMKSNCDTLRRIRKEGDRLIRESQTGDFSVRPFAIFAYPFYHNGGLTVKACLSCLQEFPALSADDSDEDVPCLGASVDNDDLVRPRPRKRARFAGPPLQRSALRCPKTAPAAAREGLRRVTAGMLDHAGFEGEPFFTCRASYRSRSMLTSLVSSPTRCERDGSRRPLACRCRVHCESRADPAVLFRSVRFRHVERGELAARSSPVRDVSGTDLLAPIWHTDSRTANAPSHHVGERNSLPVDTSGLRLRRHSSLRIAVIRLAAQTRAVAAGSTECAYA